MGAAVWDGQTESTVTNAICNHKQVERIVRSLSSEKLPQDNTKAKRREDGQEREREREREVHYYISVDIALNHITREEESEL